MGEEPINKMSSKLARRRLTHTLPKEERNPQYHFQNCYHYWDENDGESRMGGLIKGKAKLRGGLGVEERAKFARESTLEKGAFLLERRATDFLLHGLN